ncbi:hypothetical protein [Paraclostridium bifermentans]|uniref:hypothetical protein n=1 Tax=Paraclostridium bifermentans TaxID=1490 RepID=UPI001C803709|nr:hypothetical protein [Paraclostridium bifermentans]GIM30775.1 hypothetical protein PAGU1678_00450 [Paraclostridium bifermentans subsp. muricolitidis]
MKDSTNTSSVSKYLSLILSVVALILILIDLFTDMTILSALGFFIIGSINLYDAINSYKLDKSINYLSWIFALIGFIIAISDIFSIF